MQTAKPYRGARIKELSDLSHEEFELLLQEGGKRLLESREALKNDRDKPTPWEEITPASLTPAIKHIRKEFATNKDVRCSSF